MGFLEEWEDHPGLQDNANVSLPVYKKEFVYRFRLFGNDGGGKSDLITNLSRILSNLASLLQPAMPCVLVTDVERQGRGCLGFLAPLIVAPTAVQTIVDNWKGRVIVPVALERALAYLFSG